MLENLRSNRKSSDRLRLFSPSCSASYRNFSSAVGDEVAPLSAARQIAELATNASISTRSFGSDCAALRGAAKKATQGRQGGGSKSLRGPVEQAARQRATCGPRQTPNTNLPDDPEERSADAPVREWESKKPQSRFELSFYILEAFKCLGHLLIQRDMGKLGVINSVSAYFKTLALEGHDLILCQKRALFTQVRIEVDTDLRCKLIKERCVVVFQ